MQRALEKDALDKILIWTIIIEHITIIYLTYKIYPEMICTSMCTSMYNVHIININGRQ